MLEELPAHAVRLLSVARRMLRHEDDARDAVQDTLLHAVRALPTFAFECRLSTWLHKIVVNAALMKIRSRRRHPQVCVDDETVEALDAVPVTGSSDWALSPLDRLLLAERRREVHLALRQLPERHRRVLLLRHIAELPTDDVARRLGVSPNAVKIRIFRARRALERCLRERRSQPVASGAPMPAT